MARRKLCPRLLTVVLPFALLASACSPATGEARDNEPRRNAASSPSACFAHSIPQDAEVTLVGIYGPGAEQAPVIQVLRRDDVAAFRAALERTQRPPATPVRVIARARNGPWILVLSSYEATTWDLAAIDATELRGVLVYGYARPQVVGLAPEVPVQMVHYRPDEIYGGCGQPRFGQTASADLDALMEQVERVVGRTITRFAGRTRAESVDADNQPPTARQNSTRIISGPESMAKVAAGDQLIQRLVDEGAMRHASQNDIDAWQRRAAQNFRSSRIAPFRSSLRLGRTYVLLRPINLPGDPDVIVSIDLIVPETVRPPAIHSHFVEIYDMRTGHCQFSPECTDPTQRQASPPRPVIPGPVPPTPVAPR